ncbi:MAG: ABC transporter ATP-binding protein [Polyangiaceae bacterium]
MFLEVRDLTVSVRGPDGDLTILDNVSFEVDRGESVALVGESGSGKSLLAYALMALPPAGAIVRSGRVTIGGQNLYALRDRELTAIRGGVVSMVFQEPSSALNPVYTIGAQILEAIHLHRGSRPSIPRGLSRADAAALAQKWLTKVGMPRPEHAMASYPHELSGGMKQRALLAMALATEPDLLLADEPTAALDRTLEAQILEVLAAERATRQMALLLISHDLSAVAEVADRVIVLYAGQIVESGPTLTVLRAPRHPYTEALVASIPDPDRYPPRKLGGPPRRLPVLRGAPPVFSQLPLGCRFAPRCEQVMDKCRRERPPIVELDGPRTSRCFLAKPDPPPPDEVADEEPAP